jgi:hypothetical protein
MTRKIAGTCFAALLGFALSAAAQSNPTSPQTPQTTPTSPYPSSQSSSMDKSDHGKSSKLTGCVQSGTTAGTYELTNIKKGAGRDSASSSSTAPSSTSEPSSASSSSSKSVKLVAAAGVDLSQHVGHQVEVTGSWAPSSSSSSSSATSSTSSTTPPSSTETSTTSTSMGKDFNVTDVKMVSATCSAGTN